MAITATTKLETIYGIFDVSYHRDGENNCLSLVMGDISKGDVLIRLHSACLFGEALHATDCDCNQQLSAAMKKIAQAKKGVIIYLFQEGRGVGLENKVKAVGLQHTDSLDTVEAFNKLGFPLDERDYRIAVTALRELKASHNMIVMCNNPRKEQALKLADFKIVGHEVLRYSVSPMAIRYLHTKHEKLGHAINFDAIKVKEIINNGL
jgi:GTP cyclohydrolase II